jgi:O-antigen/teichoic acid export membrane protein
MPPAPLDLWKGRALRLGFGAAAIGATTLAGMIRNKWFAVHLAPEGLGVTGQVMSALTWLGMLAALGLGFPIARAIAAAEGAGDPDRARHVTRAALRFTLLTTAVVVAAGLFFAEVMSSAILGDPRYAGLVRIAMLGAAGYAFHLIVQGIVAGRSDVRPPLTIAIGGGLVSVVAAFALVPPKGLDGALWSAALFFPAGLLLAWLVHRRAYAGAWSTPTAPAPGHGVRALVVVGLSSLALALADQGAMLALRSHFVRVHGVAANGMFQAALAISTQVAALFYAYLSNYALGRLSGSPDAAGVTAYMRRQWIPIAAASTALFALVAALSGPLLHLLFSERFDGARPMLGWMLAGEFLRVQSLALLFGGLAMQRTKRWVAGGMLYPLGFALVYAWSGGVDPLDLARAHLAGSAIGFAGSLWLMRGAGLRLRAIDVAATALGAAALGALAAMMTP